MSHDDLNSAMNLIFNVAANALAKGNDPTPALELIIAICRYRGATPFTEEEVALYDPYGDEARSR
jgi:hypothetical protein